MAVDVVAAEVATIHTRDELVDAVPLYGVGSIISIGHIQPFTAKVAPYSKLWLYILLWVIHFKGFPSHGNQRKLGLSWWRQ